MCNLAKFYPYQCARPNATYAIGGAICRTRFRIKNCEIDYVVFALNLGSANNLIDTQGINYLPENKDVREDVLNIAATEQIELNDVVVNSSQDANLYTTAVVGSGQNCEFLLPPCITYRIPELKFDGLYELSVRTLEPNWTATGYRVS